MQRGELVLIRSETNARDLVFMHRNYVDFCWSNVANQILLNGHMTLWLFHSVCCVY